MAKITLSGFMGSGKTKIGKILSKKLNIPHFDLDDEIEKRENMKINEIFENYGEKYFRDVEKKTLNEILDKKEDFILSLGGGSILDEESLNRVIMESVPILLNGDIGVFYDRIKKDNKRPLLSSFDDFKNLYKKREKIYEKIPIKIRSDRDEDLIVRNIISLFKRYQFEAPHKISIELALSHNFKNEIPFSILDKRVFELYKKRLRIKNFYLIKNGERSKNLKEYFKIINFLSNIKFEKNDPLYIIGGGVSGDIGGFVASTYMRGVDFYLIPTTLISQIDSSIGGKNGLNLSYGKNLVGTIYLPKEVFIDPSFLFTLNKREIISGLGEIFKYSILNKNGIFDLLELNEKIDFLEIISLIIKSIKEKIFWIKDDILDKKEKRIYLNLGHTTGHILETLLGYGKISHGEAVAFGIIFSSFISLRENLMKESIFDRIFKIYKKLEFNYKKILKIKNLKDFQIYDALLVDKKSKNKKLNLIIPLDIGEVKILKDFEIKNYIKYLKEFILNLEELWKEF